jgi:hypothetical protein
MFVNGTFVPQQEGNQMGAYDDATETEKTLRKQVFNAMRDNDKAEVKRLSAELRAIYHARCPDVAAMWQECRDTL